MTTTTTVYVREPSQIRAHSDISGAYVLLGSGAALSLRDSGTALALADACQEAGRLLRRAEVERANTQVPA